MSKITFFFFCAQLLIIQTAYGQTCGCSQSLNQGYNIGNSYGSGIGLIGSNSGYNTIPTNLIGSCGSNIGYNAIPSSSVGANIGYGSVSGGNNGGYGGYGEGQLQIGGQVPIAGNTYVDGNLPVIGLVEFNGNLPAIGYVTVSGCTPCDCNQYSINF